MRRGRIYFRGRCNTHAVLVLSVPAAYAAGRWPGDQSGLSKGDETAGRHHRTT